MPNIDKVIEGLWHCQIPCEEGAFCDCSSCPYDCGHTTKCKVTLKLDALKLLQEYRSAKPLIDAISDQMHDCAKMFRRSKDDNLA